MILRTITFTILLLISGSCTNNIKKKVPSFDLHRDLQEFSTQMEEGDTLFIFANLSACSSWWFEKNTLVKQNNKIVISTEVENDYKEDSLQQKKAEYITVENDTLNFEDLFKMLTLKATKKQKISTNEFTVVNKKDTIRFFSDGLGDHLEHIGYYISIKRRIYPKEKIYQPVKPPPKPPVDSFLMMDK